MFIAIHPSIINPIPEPNITPEKTLLLFLSLIALILAPVPKTLCIALITNCIGYINENILITDRDCVIASSGSLKKKYNGKEISQSLSNIIDKRSVTLNNSNDGLEIISGIVEESKYIVSSVIVSGDAVGSVIILSDENINDTEEKCSNFIAKFLSKHLE